MILLSIKRPLKYKFSKLNYKGFDDMKAGESLIKFIGKHPNNHERGSVVIGTTLLEGNFDQIEEILFIAEEPQIGKLLKWEKRLLGGYKIEVGFNIIFGHGLKYTTQQFIRRGGGIIGLTKKDKESLKTIEGQKSLLKLLIKLIIPRRQKDIYDLAVPSFLLIPNNKCDEEQSHFVGSPKAKIGTEIPTTVDKAQLMHLASINLNEFKNQVGIKSLKKYLSFYIKINDTENGWPQRRDEFKVFNNESISDIQSDGLIKQEEGVNFNIQLFIDLPMYNHSRLEVLNLSEEEKHQYEALETVFKNLTLGNFANEGVNKLFGYPDSIQHCVAYEAERLKNNRTYSDHIYKDAINWTLLFQVSPDCKNFNFFSTFGSGVIYYMIKQHDLKNANFEDVQVVVQYT